MVYIWCDFIFDFVFNLIWFDLLQTYLFWFVRYWERSLSKQTTHVYVFMWWQQIYIICMHVCSKRNTTQHKQKTKNNSNSMWFINKNKPRTWIFALIVKSQTHALSPIFYFAKATKMYAVYVCTNLDIVQLIMQ